MSAHTLPTAPIERQTKIPLSAVLALATAVFATSLTETLPAGLLPQMSAGLGVSESAAGQTVTLYAIGTALTTIPLTAATASWRRKRLLLAAIAGFLIANTVTALSTSYLLTMGARFVAGVAAGVAWALLAGYARRISPPHLQGRALAIAMAGIPVALSLGVPAGAFLGQLFGWRVPFLLMSVLAVVLLGWIGASVPDYPGVPLAERRRVLHALGVHGVPAVLVVTLVFVIAHTVLYTYISTYLRGIGRGGDAGVFLLVFGLASLIGVWVVGARIDTSLRSLTTASIASVLAASALLLTLHSNGAALYLAAVLWGLGWGGVPTLLQTAVGDAGGTQGDSAQALLVVLWNVAMAGGGVLGGVQIDAAGETSLPITVAGCLVVVLAVVVGARRHAFPPGTRA